VGGLEASLSCAVGRTQRSMKTVRTALQSRSKGNITATKADGSGEAVSRLGMERAFSPLFSIPHFSWGRAPG
jgi:hypothetical protein